jgi:hypothetical protein
VGAASCGVVSERFFRNTTPPAFAPPLPPSPDVALGLAVRAEEEEEGEEEEEEEEEAAAPGGAGGGGGALGAGAEARLAARRAARRSRFAATAAAAADAVIGGFQFGARPERPAGADSAGGDASGGAGLGMYGAKTESTSALSASPPNDAPGTPLRRHGSSCSELASTTAMCRSKPPARTNASNSASPSRRAPHDGAGVDARSGADASIGQTSTNGAAAPLDLAAASSAASRRVIPSITTSASPTHSSATNAPREMPHPRSRPPKPAPTRYAPSGSLPSAPNTMPRASSAVHRAGKPLTTTRTLSAAAGGTFCRFSAGAAALRPPPPLRPGSARAPPRAPPRPRPRLPRPPRSILARGWSGRGLCGGGRRPGRRWG